jgi:RNA polymerase sigma factor FliA
MNSSMKETIAEHTVLVKRIANHLLLRLPAHIQVEDLIQAGMIGLIEAFKNFRTDKGARFSTYAGIRIRGAMLDEMRKGDWVPRSVHKNTRRITESMKILENRTGCDARDADIAQDMGVALKDYYKMLRDSHAAKVYPFEDLNYADDPTWQQTHGEHMGILDALQFDCFKQSLAHHIQNLSEREGLVLSLYYDEDLNLKEVGEVLGVSESRVSQIHGQAMERLKHLLQDWKK